MDRRPGTDRQCCEFVVRTPTFNFRLLPQEHSESEDKGDSNELHYRKRSFFYGCAERVVGPLFIAPQNCSGLLIAEGLLVIGVFVVDRPLLIYRCGGVNSTWSVRHNAQRVSQDPTAGVALRRVTRKKAYARQFAQDKFMLADILQLSTCADDFMNSKHS